MTDCFVVFIANKTAVISGYCEVLFERALASSLDRNWSSKNVLVRLSWPLLSMRRSYVEEPQKENHSNNAMIQVLTDLKATKLTLSRYSCTSFQYGCLDGPPRALG